MTTPDLVERIDGANLDDSDMARLAWVVIRALADRGRPLAEAIAEGLGTHGQRWQFDEAREQLEGLID